MLGGNSAHDYSALLLDCDGVLVDSTSFADEALRRWARTNSMSPTEVVQSARGKRISEVMGSWFDPGRAEEERQRLQALELSMASGTTACRGARRLVERLDGRAPWAVVTSADRRLAQARLKAAQLPEPPVLIAAEDVGRGKPAPDCYLRAANLLGVPIGECLAIDDLAIGVKSAGAAGARALRVDQDADTGVPDTIRHLSDISVLVRDGLIRVSVRSDRPTRVSR